MRPCCPKCRIQVSLSESRPTVVCNGSFRRRSDRALIHRFRCQKCLVGFSWATLDPCYRQKKRQINSILQGLLASGVSQRRAALLLAVNPKTVVRKFVFLGQSAQVHLAYSNLLFPRTLEIQFDDMETFEHTKCKPLSITLAVEQSSRRILGFQVSQMPAKGKLAKIARAKYGPREDHRPEGRKKLLLNLQSLLKNNPIIKSDENPHYPKDLMRFFPKARHVTYKGRRGCVVGQGELKKIGFDPLFSLNHTCAKLRADVNRLFRRTWCTTKKPERLALHLAIAADFHNWHLTGALRSI